MNIHDATEQAYKNGYADGKKEVANILSDLKKAVHNKAVYSNSQDIPYYVQLKVFDAVLNDFIRRCQGE